MMGSVAPEEQDEVTKNLTEIQMELLRRDLSRFVKRGWSVVEPQPYVSGWHLDAICEHLMALYLGEIRQLIINIPPRHTKSLCCSVFFPAWVWTDNPREQLLTGSYSASLSVRDALKSRRLIQSKWYMDRWGGKFSMAFDENLKARYSNDKGGYRISHSVGGTTTGEGGTINILDDPNNMKEIYSEPKRQEVIDFIDNVWLSRANDPKKVRRLVIQQRGHEEDATGHLLTKQPDRWVHLCLPLEYDPKRKCVTPVFKDPRKKRGDLLNPERFGEEEVADITSGMSNVDYNAQFNQDPFAGGGIILKKQWWRKWPDDAPPPVVELVVSVDTALEDDEEGSEYARTTWGLFWHSETGDPSDEKMHAILIWSWSDHCSYPDFRHNLVVHHKKIDSDLILVERKASGHQLIPELRRSKLPARGVRLAGARSQAGKVERANLAAHPLEQGTVWYMDNGENRETLQQCAKFPRGALNDRVDTVTQALMYFRRRFALETQDEDEEHEDLELWRDKRWRSIYG